MTQHAPLRAAIGRYKHTEALSSDGLWSVELLPVANRAFAPMVREQRFDVSELAIATFLMARAAGSDLVLLPVVLAARFQNGALLRRAADRFGPADLRGRRIGARAYSQTTGLWLRGALQEEYGLRPRGATSDAPHRRGLRQTPLPAATADGVRRLEADRLTAHDAAAFAGRGLTDT